MVTEKNPRSASPGQTDVAGRNAASTAAPTAQTAPATATAAAEAGGVSAEGAPNAGTHMESRLQTAADSSVSPKSSTLQNPDAEIRADLTTDVLTANREAMQAEVRSGEGSTDLKKLQKLHQAVADAQVEVDAAIKKRDAARDAYDREAEAHATASSTTFGAVTADYFKAADKHAAEEAAFRRKMLAR